MEVGAGEEEKDIKDEFWISAFKEPFNTEGKPQRPANSEVENK